MGTSLPFEAKKCLSLSRSIGVRVDIYKLSLNLTSKTPSSPTLPRPRARAHTLRYPDADISPAHAQTDRTCAKTKTNERASAETNLVASEQMERRASRKGPTLAKESGLRLSRFRPGDPILDVPRPHPPSTSLPAAFPPSSFHRSGIREGPLSR